MKKACILFLPVILAVCLLGGCSKKDISGPPLRSYVFKESEEAVKPYVSLQKDHKFEWMYSVLSSDIGLGSYETDNDSLILTTSDGKNSYRFKTEDGALVFQAEQSSSLPSFANVPDGAVFQ